MARSDHTRAAAARGENGEREETLIGSRRPNAIWCPVGWWRRRKPLSIDMAGRPQDMTDAMSLDDVVEVRRRVLIVE